MGGKEWVQGNMKKETRDWVKQRIDESFLKHPDILSDDDYPEFDMDGSRFTPEFDEEHEEKIMDSTVYSISKRLFKFWENVLWYETQEHFEEAT